MSVDRKTSLPVIGIIILLIFCISVNIFMYNKLNKENEKSQSFLLNLYAKEIERLILKDFLKIFQHNYTTNDLSIIRNYSHEIDSQNTTSVSQVVYISNNTLHVKTANEYLILDLSNIKQILDAISENVFLYSLSIDNKQILTNTIVDLTDNKLLNIPITKNLLLTLNLKHAYNSQFIALNNKALKTNIVLILALLISVFFVGLFVIFWFCNQRKKLQAEIDHKNNILLFINRDKDFIIQCYEYSKKSKSVEQEVIEENYNNDYLPLSIANNIENNKEVEILVKKITLAINDYFVFYKKYYQLDNIELDIINDNLEKIALPFDYEVFYQIMIGIIYNLMNFNKKSVKKRKIIIILKKSKINIISDGLKLNKEYAIKASAMIFQDTANPYLMNFGQMFVLFNTYNIKFDVNYNNNDGTNITILLPNNKKSKSTNFEIIELSQYRGNKK